MTQTKKNWLTTALFTSGAVLLTYLFTNAPGGDTWAQWRPVLFVGLGTFVGSVFHAYQERSGIDNGQPSNDAKTAAKIAGGLLVLFLGVALLGQRDEGELSSTSYRAESVQVEQDDGTFAIVETPVMGQGCTPSGQVNVPEVVTISIDTLQAVACGVGVIGKDVGTMTSVDGGAVNWGSVAIDLGTTCGMDVSQIIQAFGASSELGKAANANAASVHQAALSYSVRRTTVGH